MVPPEVIYKCFVLSLRDIIEGCTITLLYVQGAASTEESVARKTGWGGKKSFLDVSRFGRLGNNLLRITAESS